MSRARWKAFYRQLRIARQDVGRRNYIRVTHGGSVPVVIAHLGRVLSVDFEDGSRK